MYSNELEKINIKINILENKIDKLLLLIETEVKPDCNKMSYHIDFIERIYDKVKSPMEYICNKINYFNIDYLYSKNKISL